MKKPVSSVYYLTANYTNKMEMINSLKAYIRRSEKAFIKNDKDTLETCCKEISLLIDKILSQYNLTEIQVKRIDGYKMKAEKYNEYLKEM